MKDTYEKPVGIPYASREMLYLFSPDKKFTTWHRLWIALARAEMGTGPAHHPGPDRRDGAGA